MNRAGIGVSILDAVHQGRVGCRISEIKPGGRLSPPAEESRELAAPGGRSLMQIIHPFHDSIQLYEEKISDPDRCRPDICPRCQAGCPLIARPR